ncbi:hypothetical protein A5893_12885 [Pedobacter psychrophilus]|uniref:DUF748 domain-containing protein n=1 Tax=Pedobacter psychrophilus TaxID=1826909 RepID=A0A179DD08_9SPHI|nr:hypothetical protein [Pedobacter psychrophilus]OAQ38927.1 hypothetical protein A5893_12885 [Pedobacter psychrophilus]
MEENKPRKKHTLLKWIAGIFIVILIIAAAAAWYINNQWKPLLTNVIKNTFTDTTDSLYRIDFSDISVNILSGSVTVDSVSIKPDLDVYQKMIKQGIAPENLISLKIYKLSIKNANPIKVYRQKKLDIKNITIQNPELAVFYTKLKNQKKKKEDNRTAYERLKSTLNSLKIGSIFLNNVKFKYIDQNYEEPKITFLDKMNIRINDLLIDSTSRFDSTRLFGTKDVIAEISDYSFATSDSMYHMKLKHALVSTQNKKLTLTGVGLIPRYPNRTFTAKYKTQQERYQLTFDSVLINDLDFDQLLDERTIKSSNLTLTNGDLNVFMDRGKPAKTIDKGKNFPHLALSRIAWNIIVDTVIIKNTNVAYTEYNPKSKANGTVFFSNMRGRIFNVTNDSASLSKQNTANAYIQTNLMGKGNMNVHIGFNLTDPNGAFNYDGSMGAMEMSALNDLFKNMALVSTSSGQIQSFVFNMKGNKAGAGGTMTLKYQDLKISLMKKDDEEKFKKLGLISFFANALLVNNGNPNGKDPLIVANSYYKRPNESSFFNLMWKSIFEGIKQSVGITKEKEDSLKAKADNFKNAKVDREKRKEERIKRREERKKDK